MWKESEIRLLSSKVYTPQELSFGVPGEKDDEGRLRCKRYFSCRDFFQNQRENNKGLLEEFWFCHGKNHKGENVAAFFEEVEKRLKVKPRSKFGPTSRSEIMWVQWSPFWRKYSMRRSLFTAFMRAAVAYEPGDPVKTFEFAINSQYYTNQTKAAVDLFLEGCTIYTGAKNFGWHDAFQYKDAKASRKILRKPVATATP